MGVLGISKKLMRRFNGLSVKRLPNKGPDTGFSKPGFGELPQQRPNFLNQILRGEIADVLLYLGPSMAQCAEDAVRFRNLTIGCPPHQRHSLQVEDYYMQRYISHPIVCSG